MTTKTNDSRKNDSPADKRPYQKPRLVVYGDLSKLTRTTSGGSEVLDGLKIGTTQFRTS